MPSLTQLATIPSEYQEEAASLTVQAKLLQVNVAMSKLDYTARKRLCSEAVHFGKLSGDTRMYATALSWQGGTYIYCERLPHKAITILHKALASLNSDASLNKSQIFIDLAIVYAQDGKRDKALEMVEQAKKAMPLYPELDPLYQCIGFGSSELNQFEGRMYLHLAEHFPNDGYAQIAYDAFDKGINKQAMTKGSLGRALIRKADAASALGEMEHFLDCLTQGLLIAIEIDNKKRLSEAYDVMQHIPESWQKETKIQNLQKDLSQAIIVAYR